jgi:4-carboxymuconolactone decarboxylase
MTFPYNDSGGRGRSEPATARVSEALFVELSRSFDTIQILELIVTAGWYHTVVFAAGMDLAPEAWAVRFPAP